MNWLTVDAFNSLTEANQYFARYGGDTPESSVSALFATATGNGLFANGSASGSSLWSLSITDSPGLGTGASAYPVGQDYPGTSTSSFNWYQVPRTIWPGSPMGSTSQDLTTNPVGSTYPGPTSEALGGGIPGPCNTTTNITSYPCFRQSVTPVFVMMSSAPAHNGPGGQYPYVETPAATNSPVLEGANYWPLQPTTSGASPVTGCPAGYGGPIGGTAGAMCMLLRDASGNNGLSFETAMALPSDPGNSGLPLPGVYYGVVPGATGISTAARAPGTSGSPDWWSASSVGGGIINLPTVPGTPGTVPTAVGAITSTIQNGFAQRSSLRDCSATDGGNQCTPQWSGASSYPVSCINDTTTGSNCSNSASAAAGNST